VRRPLLLALTVAGAAVGVVLFASVAGASPADPTSRPLTQPDGSTFAARLYGDEFLNGYETDAGYTVVKAADGTWRFAAVTAAGRLVATALRPEGTGVPPAGADLEPHVRDAAALEQAQAERESAEGTPTPTPPQVGTQDVLVVLAQFSDRALTTTPAEWSDLFFGPTRSVRDYYATASFGALDLAPATETEGTVDDGVVTVTLPTPHPDSGQDFGTFNAVTSDVLAAIEPFVDVDAYDTDNDGRLAPDELHLGIVVAGTEAAQGCVGPSVWAHRSSLDSPVTLDGVTVGDFESNGGFFAGGELQCSGGVGLYQSTVGIWVHELGHDLGLIDLYDADGSSGGVDSWSVMGIHWLSLPGEAIGERPPLPDPFSRWSMGWLTPNQVTTISDDVSLSSSATTDDVVQVRDNPDGVDVGFLGGAGQGEYFLVENRQPEGYDIALPGCGLLVWHIDESQGFNSDDDARRVDVEEAGGGLFGDGYADENDPYPAEGPVNTVFGPTSRPESSLSSGLPSGVALTDFSPTCGPTQTLDVDPGGGPVPRPANNHLLNARTIALRGSGSIQRQVKGHNVGASAQAGEPRHAGGEGRRTVWWAVRAPTGGFLDITSQATFQETIAVYTGNRIGNLQPVRAVRGLAPNQGAGSPPAPGGPPTENVYQGLGFRVDGGVRYLIAVDARRANASGGIRLLLNFDSARPDVRPARRVLAPGARPVLRVQIRNASAFERLRVYGLYERGQPLQLTDCPAAFLVAPGTTRTCHARSRVSGPAGATLASKVEAWIEWPNLGRYSTVADPWFARVRR
jgi:M6 family metalloprotease-like protein